MSRAKPTQNPLGCVLTAGERLEGLSLNLYRALTVASYSAYDDFCLIAYLPWLVFADRSDMIDKYLPYFSCKRDGYGIAYKPT